MSNEAALEPRPRGSRGGRRLFGARGAEPLRLVVAGDQLTARWVRKVGAIELITGGAAASRSPQP